MNQAIGTGPFAASDCRLGENRDGADIKFCMRHVGTVATAGFQVINAPNGGIATSFHWRIQGHAPGAANQTFEEFYASNAGEYGTTVTIWADRAGVPSTVCAQTASQYDELSPSRDGSNSSIGC